MSYLLKNFSHYFVTFALIIVLITLIRQNLFINNFPFSLYEKQAIIDKNIQHNNRIKQQNKAITLKLQALYATDGEILESQSRYRFGFIKKNERYYRVNE
ncbi:MAG: cell division protein FtsB [Gammaproteobacteria bacterium]|nr:MAG: cell division protein FtsB [Gammaproteobacteria bacterium]